MQRINRRRFTQSLAAAGLGVLALPAWAQGRKNLRLGHTGITWPWGEIRQPPPGGGRGRGPGGPRQIDPQAVETVFRDVAETGFHGIEIFAWQVDAMEAHGGIGPLIEKYTLPLISVYGGPNLTNPDQRRASLDQTIANAKLVRQYGGKVIVFGPNGVNRNTFVFNDHRANIIAALNDGAKAVTDLGLTAALHPHTGTCIETRDETYAIMENVDTRYLKFGPDVGQLAKGGADPVQVVKDFLALVEHLHLKDFDGGPADLGYAPIGRGQVNLGAILDMCEGRQMNGMVMVELDSSDVMPIPARGTAEIARTWLQNRGHEFRG
jgi:inosose dehydratase